MHYQRLLRGAELNPEPKPIYASCQAAGCDGAPRSTHATYCATHYHREYRHGTASFTSIGKVSGVSQVRAYRTIAAKNHPLSMRNGRAYEHRVVLFDSIGDGTHPCHWCDTAVVWGPNGTPNMLVPDHVNGVGDDNRLDNLVPSCISCNTARGQQARSHELRKRGMWSNNDTIKRLTTKSRRSTIKTSANAAKR